MLDEFPGLPTGAFTRWGRRYCVAVVLIRRDDRIPPASRGEWFEREIAFELDDLWDLGLTLEDIVKGTRPADLMTSLGGLRVGFEIKYLDRDIYQRATELATHAARLKRATPQGCIAILVLGISKAAFGAESPAGAREMDAAFTALLGTITRAPGYDAVVAILIGNDTDQVTHAPTRMWTGWTAGSTVFEKSAASLSGAVTSYLSKVHTRGSAERREYKRRAIETRIRERGASKFLLIGSEWAASKGGISSFNLELAKALVVAGKRVCVAVPSISATEIEEANDLGIQVAIPKESIPGISGEDALLGGVRLLNPGTFVPDVIVGHGRILGPAAYALQSQFKNRPMRMHIVHMDPEQLELAKEADGGGTRTQIAAERKQVEVELAAGADLVAGVGTRLSTWISDEMLALGPTAPSVVTLQPGLRQWPELSGQRRPPQGRSILVIARAEDFASKGLELAVRAVGGAKMQRMTGEQLSLVIRGVPEDHTLLRDRVNLIAAEYGLKVIFRTYTVDPHKLTSDLATALCVLMPSSHEGFGLSAYEAISAGVPTIISSESGLRDLLVDRTTDGRRRTPREVVAVGTPNAPKLWAAAVGKILDDPDEAFARAADLRSQIDALQLWDESIAAIDQGLKEAVARHG